MRVLVTGAAGFIGSHLCERLIQLGYEVTGVDNFDGFYARSMKEKNLENLRQSAAFHFYETDLEDPDAFAAIGPERIDCVIHLAAKAGVLPSLKNPKKYFQTNIDGTYNVLEFIREREIGKMVFASSSSIYGNNEKIPFSEKDCVDHPISPYAFSKKACELLNYTYHHLYKIDIVNLRFFTVYGPRQRPDLAIHKFFKRVQNDEPITIYGDGSTARDYTFITDTASGIVQSLRYILDNSSLYETFNLGNNKPVKLIDLVNTIYEIAGKKPNLQFLPMQPGDVNITFADIAKAGEQLNYHPKVSLRDGIREFYKWFLLQEVECNR